VAIGVTELKLGSYAPDQPRPFPLGALARLRRDGTSRLFAGCLISFAAPCDISAPPPFTQDVHRFIARIPYSETRSYAWVARKLGKPKAARVVGNALAHNLLPITIPCHRIVRAGGTIGAFALGSEWQKKLLSLEKRYAKSATSRK